MSTATSLRTDIEKELECPICLELLNKPRLLTCLHSLCQKCTEPLLKHYNGKHYVECPTCRQNTEVPRGAVSELPRNFVAENISLKLSLDKGEVQSLTCDSCRNSKCAITGFCVNCTNFLCEVCHRAHKSMRHFSSHHTMTMAKVKQKGVESLPRNIFCNEHAEEKVKFYCNTCESLVCHLCPLVRHKNHEFEEIQVIFQRRKKMFKEEATKAEKTKKSLEKALECAEITYSEIDVNKDKVVQEINEMINDLISLLEKRRQELFTDVEELTMKKKKSVKVHINMLRVEVAKTASVLEFTKEMVKMSENPAEFISLEKTIQKHLKEVNAREYDLELQETSDMFLQGQMKFKKIIKELGDLGNIADILTAFAPQCEVSGLSNDSVAVNKPHGDHVKLTVKTKNIRGEELKKGDANVVAILSEKEKHNVKEFVFSDNKKGSYECMLDVNSSGSYEVDIVINEEKSTDSPYRIDSWLSDPERKDYSVVLDDGMLKGSGSGRVVGDVVFAEGCHEWSVRINEFSGCVDVGIIGGKVMNTDINWSECDRWYWNYSKIFKKVLKYYPDKGVMKEFDSNMNMIKGGDVLSILLDLHQKTITLTDKRTGENETITGVEPPVRPYFVVWDSSFTLV